MCICIFKTFEGGVIERWTITETVAYFKSYTVRIRQKEIKRTFKCFNTVHKIATLISCFLVINCRDFLSRKGGGGLIETEAY